ncbi:glycosyltransferase family 2 protein [Streptomyces sp. NPDC007251]|uniref:glycosyltransferase family 2 protein n=1 Tax=Streptomyces sp. NPDC007251 TaxID=3154483 RepID=UPI0033F98662
MKIEFVRVRLRRSKAGCLFVQVTGLGLHLRKRAIAHALRGRVVSVPRAYVTTDMPETVKGTYRQRLRWGKSGWRFIRWELTDLAHGVDGNPAH